MKKAMAEDNIQEAKSILTEFINHLPSSNYTQQSLENLAASLSGDCNITAEVLCFNSIKTLPPQSEMRISYNSSGSTISKTIDLSSTPENKIKVVNMHE